MVSTKPNPKRSTEARIGSMWFQAHHGANANNGSVLATRSHPLGHNRQLKASRDPSNLHEGVRAVLLFGVVEGYWSATALVMLWSPHAQMLEQNYPTSIKAIACTRISVLDADEP
jgi:hypothetical protein